MTLLVTAIESLVFRLYLKIGFRAVAKRVLIVNILSTLARGRLNAKVAVSPSARSRIPHAAPAGIGRQ